MTTTRDHSHDQSAPVLDVANVTLRFDTRVVLKDVTFTLQAGERVAIVGPNGAGKSCLFKAIAGALKPASGNVLIGGHGEPGSHICIAYLPQRSEVDWRFPVTVRDVVMMGRVGQLGFLRRPGAKDKDLVQKCLVAVDLVEVAHRQINELSGGEQQRMFIAQALAQEAHLMLMDEPFSGLDAKASDHIFRILDDLKEQNVTVMVATHNLDMAAERFDRVMLLNGRIIGFGNAREVFTAACLKDAYGHHLQMIETKDGVMVLSDTCCDGHHET